MYIITYSCTFEGKTQKAVHLYSEDDYELALEVYDFRTKLLACEHLCLWHCPRLSFSDIVKDAEILKAVDFNGKGDKDL